MKTLYAGNLERSGTCYSRLTSLKQLQQDVVDFSVYEYKRQLREMPHWKRAIASWGVWKQANQKLIGTCLRESPDLLWLDTGEWVSPATLNWMRARGMLLVRHMTDALHPRSPFWLRLQRHWLRRAVADFDLVFTTNERDAADLEARLGSKIQLTDLGYDHRRFDTTPLSPELQKKWANEIVFVGHHEARTEAAVLALIDAGIPITVYGHSRWFRSQNRARLGHHLQPSLNDEDYQAALKGAKIGLCMVSEWNYNQTAARSFEIPASGTFLLAPRTPHHVEYYQEGVEAEFFGDHRELIQKARYYLDNDAQREAVASRGQQRCVQSGYSWDAIMKRDWEKVLQLRADLTAEVVST